jgi:hypothetical protein
MTEAEWLTGDDPLALLAHLRGQGNSWARRLLTWLRMRRRDDRHCKARLFACACCRRIWPLLVTPVLRRAVEVAERFANGEVSAGQLAAARAAAAESPWGAAARAATRAAWESAWDAAFQSATEAIKALDWVSVPEAAADAVRAERRVQCVLLRDLFGNPFRPIRIERPIAWLSDDLLEEVRAIDQKHDFDALPHLAERLQAAGCRESELLDHCRSTGPHAHGCWVLNVLLGREEER